MKRKGSANGNSRTRRRERAREPHVIALPSTMKPESTIFFLCDIQSKFRAPVLSLYSIQTFLYSFSLLGPVINGFDHVVATANKLLNIAKVNILYSTSFSNHQLQILGCEVVCTTQYSKGISLSVLIISP